MVRGNSGVLKGPLSEGEGLGLVVSLRSFAGSQTLRGQAPGLRRANGCFGSVFKCKRLRQGLTDVKFLIGNPLPLDTLIGFHSAQSEIASQLRVDRGGLYA